jgi:hypothetical protein
MFSNTKLNIAPGGNDGEGHGGQKLCRRTAQPHPILEVTLPRPIRASMRAFRLRPRALRGDFTRGNAHAKITDWDIVEVGG